MCHDGENYLTNQTNAFAKHKSEYHLLEEPEFKLTVLKSFAKPLQRQLLEGLEIRHGESSCDVLMNSKLDHHAPAVARVHLTTSIAEKPQQSVKPKKRKGGDDGKGPDGKKKREKRE